MRSNKKTIPEAGFIQADKAGLLFAICWLAYFAANIGRMAYTVSIAEIIATEGYSKVAVGLVGTGFFICYGAGQLLSGYLGDRLPPRWMELFGLLSTGICNLLMAFTTNTGQMLLIWCLNGVIQSTLWPPMSRIISEYFPLHLRKNVCVNLATTYPVATLLSYALAAVLIHFLGWRPVFIWYGIFIVAVAGVWVVGFGRLDACREPAEDSAEDSSLPETAAALSPAKPWFPVKAVVFFCLALTCQGFLRDGLMTWVSPYISDTFSLGSSFAILSTCLLPVVNIGGVYATNHLYRLLKNEGLTSACLFGFSLLGAAGLLLFGNMHFLLALLFFALITACMMGVNLMLVSFVPIYFVKQKKVALVSGLTNSMVYVGSSVSTFGIGALADQMGWNAMLVCLLLITITGILFCMLAKRRWAEFMESDTAFTNAKTV